MDAPGYAELHSLSNFSFLRGASHPAELVRRAQALGYRALALTDERSLPEAPGGRLRLIIGAEFSTTGARKLVLLAPSQQAYAQLCRLITLGRRRSPKGTYRLRRGGFEGGVWGLPGAGGPRPAPPPRRRAGGGPPRACPRTPSAACARSRNCARSTRVRCSRRA